MSCTVKIHKATSCVIQMNFEEANMAARKKDKNLRTSLGIESHVALNIFISLATLGNNKPRKRCIFKVKKLKEIIHRQEMKNFEDFLKTVKEDFNEVLFEEITILINEGQQSNFYIVLVYHFISIFNCNNVIECVINFMVIIEYLLLSSSYFLHAC